MSIKCRAYKQYQKHLIAVARLLACSSVFRELFADCVPVLWLIALANTCEQNETTMSIAYARHAGRQSTADEWQRVEDDERERTRSGEFASGVSSELASAQLVTDYQGNEYQRLEYTPYGELWIENVHNNACCTNGMSSFVKQNSVSNRKVAAFTGKELDEETGLYYFVARYLDPKYSRWLSSDPALGDYIPVAPVDDEAKKHNSQLPGQGGIYNLVNLQLYHYASNNPIKYNDPDGKYVLMAGITVTGGMGTGVTMETGIILSKDNKGNFQLGLYQVSGSGLMSNVGASATVSISYAPFAQEINDIKGRTETIGGSGSPIVGLPFFSAGLDVNIPIDGPLKNFYVSGHVGVATKSEIPEGHMMTTTTTAKVYVKEGKSFSDVWNKATELGMFKDLPQEMVDHFRKAYRDYGNEEQ